MTALPWKEFDARYPGVRREGEGRQPAGRPVLPMTRRDASRAERRAQTRMALFKAALAVVQGGPDRLKDIKDPFGDGPFEYRASGEGFELKSKLLHQGKPVTLTVGQRTKP